MKNTKDFKTTCLLLIFSSCIILMPAVAFAQQESVTALIQQAGELGINQASLAELRERADSRGIGNQELATIISSAHSLAGQQLPSDHIIQKALEGMSKGVPGSRISMVITRIQQATEESAQIVKPWMQNLEVRNMVGKTGEQPSQVIQNELIKSASKAIAQNTPAQVVADIFSDLNDASVLSNTNSANIVTAIGILPDLPTTAAQPELSRAFVVRALRGGFSATDLQKLPTALNIAQMRNQLPAASVIQGVANQLQGGIPASQILQNLFNGNIGGGPPGNIPPGLENRPGQGQGNG